MKARSNRPITAMPAAVSAIVPASQLRSLHQADKEPSQRVGRDRQEVVTQREQLTSRGGLPSERVLRDHRIDDDDDRVRGRQGVDLLQARPSAHPQAARARPRSRSPSFHAATTSSVRPRTPSSQSWAIAALWTARPAMSATSANAPSRRAVALVNDRHQGQAEVHDPDAPGEERLETSASTAGEHRSRSSSGEPVRGVRDAVGEPVHKGQSRVHLDREPAIRVVTNTRRPTRSARHEEPLPHPIAHVLDHRIREDDVERTVGEGEGTRISLHIRDVWIPRAEPDAVLEPERGNASGPRVQLLQEIERPAAVTLAEPELVGSDIEEGRLRGRLELVEKSRSLRSRERSEIASARRIG